MSQAVINDTKHAISNISLTEDYRSRQYKKNFSKHFDVLFNTAEMVNPNHDLGINNSDNQLTKQLYWQLEAYILENLEIDLQDELVNEFYDLEDMTRDKLIKELGKFYDSSGELNDIIDYSVNGFVMSSRFNLTSDFHKILNPWNYSKDILSENGIIHSFYRNTYKLKQMGVELEDDNDSKEIKGHKVALVGKGRKKKYSSGFIRDIFGLRGHVLNIIKEKAPNNSKSITSDEIIKILRSQGIGDNEFSESQIRSLLIQPHKKMGKIGSHKEGYFTVTNESDLEITYGSHFEKFKGYLGSLEEYRVYANTKGWGQNPKQFEAHIKYLKDFLGPWIDS